MKPVYTITMPKYMDEKVSLLHVRSYDNSTLHQSWKTNDGRIIAFESNQEDYPANALIIFDDINEYVETIRNVEWMNDRTLIVNQSEELKMKGFPFDIG